MQLGQAHRRESLHTFDNKDAGLSERRVVLVITNEVFSEVKKGGWKKSNRAV